MLVGQRTYYAGSDIRRENPLTETIKGKYMKMCFVFKIRHVSATVIAYMIIMIYYLLLYALISFYCKGLENGECAARCSS